MTIATSAEPAIRGSPEPNVSPLSGAPTRRASASWFGGMQGLPREHGFEPLRVEGTIPADLHGTLYRNGPALLSQQGERCERWFDGDGGVSAVRFGEGKALGASRVVMSRGLQAERAACKLVYGGFGTVQPGFFKRIRGIFDAEQVAAGPVARAHFDHHLPPRRAASGATHGDGTSNRRLCVGGSPGRHAPRVQRNSNRVEWICSRGQCVLARSRPYR